MKILFLGLLFCDQSLHHAHKYSTCGVQMAAHLFQKRLLNGFSDCEDAEVTVLNIPPTGSFPIHHKKLISPSNDWEGNCEIGFLNLPIIKRIIQNERLLKYADKWASALSGELGYLLLYSPFPPFMKVADKLKKRYPNIRIFLIQTDPIPGRGDISEKWGDQRRGDRLVRYAKSHDGFVVLTEALLDTLEAGDRPYTVTECICDIKQKPSVQKAHSENIFLYSGVTARAYGICDLAHAIARLPDATLWVCGVGEADGELRSLAEKYPNIRHFGFVNQEKLAELRDACDFLVNPRRPSGTYTKYSFPSKTAEYMMSEKPTVMYRLEGIPSEYDPYLNYLSGNAPDTISAELDLLIHSDYEVLREKAKKARIFMCERKNAACQAQKILDLFKKLYITHREAL